MLGNGYELLLVPIGLIAFFIQRILTKKFGIKFESDETPEHFKEYKEYKNRQNPNIKKSIIEEYQDMNIFNKKSKNKTKHKKTSYKDMQSQFKDFINKDSM